MRCECRLESRLESSLGHPMGHCYRSAAWHEEYFNRNLCPACMEAYRTCSDIAHVVTCRPINDSDVPRLMPPSWDREIPIQPSERDDCGCAGCRGI